MKTFLTVCVGNVEVFSIPSHSAGYIQQASNEYALQLLRMENKGSTVYLYAREDDKRITLMERVA